MAEQARSLKVFVSYSRTDVSFSDQLVLALEDKGFDPILDRHDISGAENWRERLGKLILSADAVASVLTAKSAASDICRWEVEEAIRLGKRIIPVTPGSLDGVLSQEVSDVDTNEIERVAMSPDTSLFYLITSRGQMKVLRTANTLEIDVSAVQGELTRAVFLPESKKFATASKDGVVRIWSTTRSERGGDINRDLPGGYTQIHVTTKGVLAGSDNDNDLFRWAPDAAKPDLIKTVEENATFATSGDASLYAVASP